MGVEMYRKLHYALPLTLGCRAVAAAHRAALGESHRDLLRRRVAHLLAHDDQSQPARCHPGRKRLAGDPVGEK